MNYTIKDLAEGKCAIDYTTNKDLEKLIAVLKEAFPKTSNHPNGICSFYFKCIKDWTGDDKTNLPTQTVDKFKLKNEMEIIGYRLIKPEYKEAALRITDSACWWRDRKKYNYDLGISETISIPNLQKAGVLDLWFEPVFEKETIKIGNYEVKFKDKDTTTIDGYVFTIEFWKAAKQILSHDKATVKVGCSKQFELDMTTVNSILEELNSMK